MKLHVLALAAALLTAPTAVAQMGGGTPGGGPFAAQHAMFDVAFPGGTVKDYADAVRAACGSALNVDLNGDAGSFPLPPITLRQVDVQTAMAILHDRSKQVSDSLVILKCKAITPQSSHARGVSPLFRVETDRRRTRDDGAISHVWSLEYTISDGREAADILTAIETSLSLFDDSFAPPELRFHEETYLLIVRAHPEQVRAIEDVIDELSGNPPVLSPKDAFAEQPDSNQLNRLKQEVEALKASLAALRTEIRTLLKSSGGAGGRSE